MDFFFMGFTLRSRLAAVLPFFGPLIVREVEAFLPLTSSVHVPAITSSDKHPKEVISSKGPWNFKAIETLKFSVSFFRSIKFKLFFS